MTQNQSESFEVTWPSDEEISKLSKRFTRQEQPESIDQFNSEYDYYPEIAKPTPDEIAQLIEVAKNARVIGRIFLSRFTIPLPPVTLNLAINAKSPELRSTTNFLYSQTEEPPTLRPKKRDIPVSLKTLASQYKPEEGRRVRIFRAQPTLNILALQKDIRLYQEYRRANPTEQTTKKQYDELTRIYNTEIIRRIGDVITINKIVKDPNALEEFLAFYKMAHPAALQNYLNQESEPWVNSYLKRFHLNHVRTQLALLDSTPSEESQVKRRFRFKELQEDLRKVSIFPERV